MPTPRYPSPLLLLLVPFLWLYGVLWCHLIRGNPHWDETPSERWLRERRRCDCRHCRRERRRQVIY